MNNWPNYALCLAFKKDGTVTAGNASGINDGASFVMLADEEAVNKYGLKPVAEIVAFGEGGGVSCFGVVTTVPFPGK